MIDRFDLLAVAGIAVMFVGLILVHPALLLVAAGYAAVNAPRRVG